MPGVASQLALEATNGPAVNCGKLHPLCLARMKVGYLPDFEEIGRYVDAASQLLADQAIRRSLPADLVRQEEPDAVAGCAFGLGGIRPGRAA
jgi:hypothetical protein